MTTVAVSKAWVKSELRKDVSPHGFSNLRTNIIRKKSRMVDFFLQTKCPKRICSILYQLSGTKEESVVKKDLYGK